MDISIIQLNFEINGKLLDPEIEGVKIEVKKYPLSEVNCIILDVMDFESKMLFVLFYNRFC